MKLIFATCFVAAAATADLSSFKFDPQNAMGELSSLMQGAQGKLAHAQKHHEKVVQKLRKATEKDFKDDMVAMETAVTDYAEEMATAERGLQIAVNSSKAELKREQAIPTPIGDWDSKSSMQKAQLNAVIGSAERSVRHLDRHNERDVREAEEQAGQVIEDQTTKLSMKLGDLTSLSDDAKKGMADHVTDESASFAVREQDKPVPKEAPLTGDEVARLEAQGKKLQDAEKKSTADIAVAKKKFSAFLAKESAQIETQTDKVGSDLAAAEKKELDRIDGKVPPKKKSPAPVAKKEVDAKKQPQKAKRELKEPRRLHNAVQKLSQKLTAKAKAAGPVNHAKVAAAPKKAAAPGRRAAHMPTKTADKKVGHLPAMREATPAERRASAHKEEMKKLRALKKPAAPVTPPARHGDPAKKAEKHQTKVVEKAAVPVKK
jgi:hypothetical protein